MSYIQLCDLLVWKCGNLVGSPFLHVLPWTPKVRVIAIENAGSPHCAQEHASDPVCKITRIWSTRTHIHELRMFKLWSQILAWKLSNFKLPWILFFFLKLLTFMAVGEIAPSHVGWLAVRHFWKRNTDIHTLINHFCGESSQQSNWTAALQ